MFANDADAVNNLHFSERNTTFNDLPPNEILKRLTNLHKPHPTHFSPSHPHPHQKPTGTHYLAATTGNTFSKAKTGFTIYLHKAPVYE